MALQPLFIRGWKQLSAYIECMAEEQKHPIKNLTERLNAIDMEKRAMMLVLQDFLEQQKKDAERLAKLDDMLSHVEALKCKPPIQRMVS